MKFKYIYIFLLFLLIGCNGSSDSGDHKDPETVLPETTFDIKVNYVQSEFPTTVEFEDAINSVNVVSESDGQCRYVDLQNKSLQTIQENGTLCLYEVLSSSGESSSKTLISSATSKLDKINLLRTISVNAIVGSSIKIDFTSELSESEHPGDSYQLSDNAYVITNGSAYTVDTDPVDDSVTIAVDSLGITRVVYSYQNVSGDVIQGFIYVVVTNEENLGLESKDLFVGATTLSTTSINISDVITLDTEDVTFLDVIAYDQTNISLTEDHDSFSFSTQYAGNYDVNYVVEDAKGSLASGVVRFLVTGSESGLENIFVDSLSSTFHYVENVSESNSNSHFAYDGTYVENGITGIADQEYPTYTYESAVATCLLRGLTLPTITELNQLWNQEKSLFSGDNNRQWPVGVSYITWNGTEEKGKLIDMSSSTSFPSAVSGDDLYGYLSCVGSTYDEILILEQIISQPTQLHILPTYDGVPVSSSVNIVEWSVDDPSTATVSESGFLTPLSDSGTVNVSAVDESGHIASKEVQIRNNALYQNEDGTKTGQDPYFNESATKAGLIPDSEINTTSCTDNDLTEFKNATGFTTSRLPLTSTGETGRLCTDSYYTPYSSNGMFMSYIYHVGTDDGEGLYLEGQYSLPDSLDDNDEIVFSGALNINDILTVASDESEFKLLIENSLGSGADKFYISLVYQSELDRWIPSVYLESGFDTKSTLMSSNLNVNESNGWVYFDVYAKLSPEALISTTSNIKYMAYINKLPSEHTLRYALDELSVTFIEKE